MSTLSYRRMGRVGLLATGLGCFLGIVAAAREGPAEKVVLLTDGRVLVGELAEDGKVFLLKQKAGTLRLARKQVEGAFDSLADVYRHKVDQIADDDPDEHRKLANWCLGHKLNAEARAELSRVLSLAPNDRQAKAQLFNLDASQARQAQATAKADTAAGRRDDALVRTAAEDARSARTGPSGGGPPAIFDLPPAQALKRYQEFALAVHPELQRRCAGCHHESSGLPFQLARAATTREQMNDLVLRTNLEATLDLIDRGDPSRSPLLVAAVLPHKGLNRPVLSGTGTPAYRVFVQWTKALALQPAASEPATADAAPSGGFGSQRGRPTAAPGLPPLSPTPPSSGAADSVVQAQRDAAAARARTNRVEPKVAEHPSVPQGTTFPKPFAAGGQPPGTAGMPPLPNPNPAPGGPAPTHRTAPPPAVPGASPLDPANAAALAPMKDATRPDPKSLYPPEFDKPKDKAKSGLNLDLLDKFLKGNTPAPARPAK